jgi:hypothetical protein
LNSTFSSFEVLDDGVDLVAVEGQGLFQLVEDADEIQHEAVGLHHLLRLVLVGTVHPRDGLQQGVVAHRLVEIHGVEHGRVEAGEQLLGDDEDLRHAGRACRSSCGSAAPSSGRGGIPSAAAGVVVAAGVHDFGILGRQELVEGVLVMAQASRSTPTRKAL